MTISAREHAALANDAYRDRSADVGKKDLIQIDGVNFRVLAVADKSSGYQGVAYQHAETGEVVIAHRGTQPTSFMDVMADADMALHGRNSQLDDAIAFTERAIEAARKTQSQRNGPIDISVTGHSLGGTLAELTAAKYGLPAHTFNAYGPAELKNLQDYGIDVHAKHPNIVNHVRATDVVAAGGHHLGEVRDYATPKDIESLRRGRYLDGFGRLGLLRNPLLSAELSAHGISNFLPDHVTGASIMTPDNEARGRAHGEAIERYRDDVVRDRIDLATLVNRAPWSLGLVNPLANARLKIQTLDAVAVTWTDTVAQGVTMVAHAVGGSVSRVDEANRDGSQKPATSSLPALALDQPGHGNHVMFRQAQAGVHRLDAERGRVSDVHSDQLSCALVVAACRAGLDRIDSVWLSNDASRAFAVQGKPASVEMRFTSVSTLEAIHTPILQSTQALEQIEQRRGVQGPQPAPAPPIQRDGPAMAMQTR